MNNTAEIANSIENLKNENESLEKWQKEASKLVQMLSDKVSDNAGKIAEIKERTFINRIRVESLPYELRDTQHESLVFVPDIMPNEETLKAIKAGKSFGAFTEAEFRVMESLDGPDLSECERALGEKLLKALKESTPDLISGLDKNLYGNLEDIDPNDADRIREYMRPDTRKFHAGILDKERYYGNAGISNISDKDSLAALKALWDQKNCLLVAEENSKVAGDNALFDNCSSFSRILCTSQEAVESYDEVLSAVLSEPKDTLVVITLSPAAAALSYDLCCNGYHVIGIGNILI
ncbi:MAG: GT-D fold domain-containing protein [Butyrivibrio sp.]|nr:GT-D fold domain-containing protein [Butyrivibrio sp.]